MVIKKEVSGHMPSAFTGKTVKFLDKARWRGQ